MKTGIMVALMLVGFALQSGCSSGDTNLGGTDRTACSGLNWRAATTGAVVCPGAPECSCSGGQVCCVSLVNGRASSGSCGDLTQCSGPALECDGPEDCAAGEVCCFVNTVGGGSSCKTPTDCFGTQEIAACRSDQDCQPLESCTPAEAGSYLAGIAAACQL
jgi:hypothetical protein